MEKKIYLAPMEGVTDDIYRRTFEKHFGGITKYFTPFLSPNENKTFPEREWREIDPARNNIENTIPQLLTNKADHFLWAVNEIAALGYKEINYNLGCPSGTVVAKKKGSGFLYYPEELDKFLYEVFTNKPTSVDISIKTRLGKADPEEVYEILDVYNKYPISELTVHPRIQQDFYREPVRPEYFDYIYNNCDFNLVYNGELRSIDDVNSCFEDYPKLSAVMLGRGLISNPMLFSEFDINKLKAFHDELLDLYSQSFSGDKAVLHRMKELWFYWSENFSDCEKSLKAIRKANRLSDYTSAATSLLK